MHAESPRYLRQKAVQNKPRHTAIYSSPAPAPASGGGGGGGGIVGGPLSIGYVNTPATVQTQTATPAQSVTTQEQGQVLGASAYNFSASFGIGASGADVTALQTLLTQEGFYSGPITGYFGVLTKAGVVKFQAANAISQTGFVGVLTRAALNTGAIPGTTTGTEGQTSAQ